MNKVRNITVSAIIIAIAFIFLYMSAVLPSGSLAALCVATACICAIIIECGKLTGFLSGAVLCVLTWLFVPDKMIAVLFTLFFSYYPLVKLFAEQKNRVSEWIIKVVYFYAVTIISIFVLDVLGIVPEAAKDYLKSGFASAGIVTLVVLAQCVFDFALSMIIDFYIRRIKEKFVR